MKDRIKSELAARGFYTLDLFRKLKYEGSFQAFQLILNNGLKNGNWECENGMWKLPTFKTTTYISPLDTEVDYLINASRQFFSPQEKDRPTLQAENYFSHENYEPKFGTLREMISDNISGYQIVPGKFQRNAEGKIKRKECWQSQQVFMLEFDKDVPFTSLSEVVEYDTFIRENAVALVESIRSGYNDPNDDTCNGDLRYRAFFLMPSVVTHVKSAEFLIEQLLLRCPEGDKSGSVITNGALGLSGANTYHINQNISLEYIHAFRELWHTEQEQQGRYSTAEQINIKEMPDAYSKAIMEVEFGNDNWSRDMLPCPFFNHEHDGWDSQNNATGVFRHSDSFGYTLHCFKCGEKKTYRVKPRKQGKRRAKKLADSEAVYQSLESAQVENQRFWDFVVSPRTFDHNRQAILIQTDTGVGKDHTMLLEAKHNDIFSLNPHTGLSYQIHQRAQEQGLRSYHIKSRKHGFEKIADLSMDKRVEVFKEDEGVMCVHADRCQALLDRTGNCKDVLCNPECCDVYDFCSRNRYVSQIRKAAQCQVAHYSWVQLLTDPGSRGIVAQILNERKRAQRSHLVWVVGEVDAHKLLNRHTVSTVEITKGIETWADEPAGMLYRLLSELCMPHLTAGERWERLVGGFPRIDGKDASRQLSRIGARGLTHTEEITVARAVTEGYVSVEDVQSIHAIPKVYPNNWTLVERLEHFLTYCQSPEPPITFNGQSLEFVTPPDLHSMCDTYVMQSATADARQLEQLLTITADDISFHVARSERVEHHEGTRIFKVATGRYVRSTCFDYDKDWEVTGVNDTIRPHLENLLSILENTPGKKFVNTYKPIYDGDVLAEDPIIELLRAVPGVRWSNWAAGFGLDIDPETVLIEFGTNEPSEYMLKDACAEVYLSDPEPLSFASVNFHEYDGVRIEGIRTYSDERVQRVYEQITEMSQYQMANRTRPVRNASTVLIYSSHPCKWLDGRVQWVVPEMLGGNLRELEIEEPKTEFRREREEKQGLVIELAKEGLSNSDIATQLGYKSQSSVANLLKGIEL